MTSKVEDFSREFDVGARKSKAFISIFVLAQATIFSGVHPAWTKHGFHTGATVSLLTKRLSGQLMT